MSYTTVSTKYQVVIPKEAREGLPLRPGQRLEVIVKGGIIHLVPVRALDELQGFASGMKAGELREGEDRR